MLTRLFVDWALIRDRQSLISIVKRLGEAKTTAEHKFKFWMLKHAFRQNKKKLTMAAINKLFLQKDAFGGIIVGSKIEPLHWQKQLSRLFCKKVCWKIFQSSQENTCAGVSFEQCYRPQAFNFITKKLQHRCFDVDFEKFLKRPIQSEVYERLHLDW